MCSRGPILCLARGRASSGTVHIHVEGPVCFADRLGLRGSAGMRQVVRGQPCTSHLARPWTGAQASDGVCEIQVGLTVRKDDVRDGLSHERTLPCRGKTYYWTAWRRQLAEL